MTGVNINISNFFKDCKNFPTFSYESAPNNINAESHAEISDWLIHKSGWPFMRLHLSNIPYEEMLNEARRLKPRFVAHRSDGAHGDYSSSGWKSLCIHGISSTHTDWIDKYPEYKDIAPDKIPWKWTDICKECPITFEYFRDVFPHDCYTRLRFMLLEPGGYIIPHRDRAEKMLSPINIALNNPESCFFKLDNYGYIPWKKNGDAHLIDISNIHSVWNNSGEDRYHIIVHGGIGSRLANYQKLLYDSYRINISASGR